jgi:hypothetical protein
MTAKVVATSWRNRISGAGEEAPDQLLANPANWRIHPKAQQDALAGEVPIEGRDEWLEAARAGERPA